MRALRTPEDGTLFGEQVGQRFEQLRTTTLAANVATAERELAALQLAKLRHDPRIKPLCTACQTAVIEKGMLDTKKDDAKTALDDHADKMIRDYESTINKLLKDFGAGFSIVNSKKTYIGGTATSTYQILINDQSVDLGDESAPIGRPSFRTTLSAGDKSTLALALFLAQLDHDPRKANGSWCSMTRSTARIVLAGSGLPSC